MADRLWTWERSVDDLGTFADPTTAIKLLILLDRNGAKHFARRLIQHSLLLSTALPRPSPAFCILADIGRLIC